MKGGVAGLYAVTPDCADTHALLASVEAALAGGARLVQYRNKSATAELRLVQGRALLALCRKHQVPLIVNDHLALAVALDADGLHLGAEDGPAAAARARLGPAKLLGVSCYDRLDLALEAQRQGADYVAFGSFYASNVKPDAVRAPLALLREARQRLDKPMVAIGGITLHNARQLVAAGADSVAVISALFGSRDIQHMARRFSAVFSKYDQAPMRA